MQNFQRFLKKKYKNGLPRPFICCKEHSDHDLAHLGPPPLIQQGGQFDPTHVTTYLPEPIQNRVKGPASNYLTRFKKSCQYSKEQVKPITCLIMKQNADFQEGISLAQDNAIPLPTLKSLIANESFQIRYYVMDFLEGV